jgi:hypothetical protein
MTTTNSGGVSRRAFVTGVATAAAGAGVVVATAGAARAADSGEGPWTWHGSDWRMVRPGGSGVVPDRSAPASTEGVVTDGARSGSFRSVPLGGGAHLHLFTFDDGMLIGLGRGLSDGAYAIVGGTGRFAGLSGAYVAQQTPATPGSEGTALFTITPKR